MDTYLELFGYLGSILVIISLLMTSVVKLRIFNAIGSGISAAYALIIGSLPLALMNIALVIINLYNLSHLLKKNSARYELVESSAQDGYVQHFLKRYGDDIHNFFPAFAKRADEATIAYITCCNGNPAGVVLGYEADGVLEVVLDYTTPTYRDCSVAAFLYPALANKGYRALHFVCPGAVAHLAYLVKMGFVEEAGAYVKHLQ